MYKFIPILKSPLWGGEKIAPYKRMQTDRPQIGEAGNSRASRAMSR